MARTKHSSPKLTIRIDPESHDKAVESNSGGCLIADAIKQQYPHLSRVSVDMATIRATDSKAGQRYTWLTPPNAQHLLLSFDQGWPQATDEVELRRAVVITPIIRAKNGPRTTDAVRQRRAERRAAAEAKLAAGDQLTRTERAVLAKDEKSEPSERPSARGRADVKTDDRGTVVHGGLPPVQGPAHPNLLRGRDRHFGAKLADPGKAFEEAVEARLRERETERDQMTIA